MPVLRLVAVLLVEMLRPPILVNTTLDTIVYNYAVVCPPVSGHRDDIYLIPTPVSRRLCGPNTEQRRVRKFCSTQQRRVRKFCCVLAVLTLPADCASVGHGVWGNEGPGWSLTVGRSGLVVRAVSVSRALLGGVVA